jgi:hypothetical protein
MENKIASLYHTQERMQSFPLCEVISYININIFLFIFSVVKHLGQSLKENKMAILYHTRERMQAFPLFEVIFSNVTNIAILSSF